MATSIFLNNEEKYSKRDNLFTNNSEIIYFPSSVQLLNKNQLQVKRVFDVFLSVIFLLFIGSWLFLIIGLLIKLESKGPVFFKQMRHGQNNVPFFCWKFRSMRYSTDGHFKQASKGDPRITKIGAWLRKTSLDELPQLYNVFVGEMSLVGPRPHAIVMNREYSENISNFMCRHMVKPGITGLAQAKGYRGEILSKFDMNGRIRYDLFYIKNWTLVMDFYILILTLQSIVFNNRNAY